MVQDKKHTNKTRQKFQVLQSLLSQAKNIRWEELIACWAVLSKMRCSCACKDVLWSKLWVVIIKLFCFHMFIIKLSQSLIEIHFWRLEQCKVLFIYLVISKAHSPKTLCAIELISIKHILASIGLKQSLLIEEQMHMNDFSSGKLKLLLNTLLWASSHITSICLWCYF